MGMFEKHYRGENGLAANAEEFRTPGVIAILMFKGAIYAGAVFFGVLALILALRFIAVFLPPESQMADDPNATASIFNLKIPNDDLDLLKSYLIYKA